MSDLSYQLYLGKKVCDPAPQPIMTALESAEITQQLGGRSGFRLVLRGSYSNLMNPLLSVFNRLILVVIVKAQAQVLIDGFITNLTHQPGDKPGITALTLTGEDLSLAMDMSDRPRTHPNLSEAQVVSRLVNLYSEYGLTPEIKVPRVDPTPGQPGATTIQLVSDLDYIRSLAERHAFVFQVFPGPEIASSTAYWGPPRREINPQPALTVNQGGLSTVESIHFRHNALATQAILGHIQDVETNEISEIQASSSDEEALADQPDWQAQSGWVRQKRLSINGYSQMQAQEAAQAAFSRSTQEVLTASGSLDTMRYGHILQVGRLVGVNGAGQPYDGLFLVHSVTHSLQSGRYRQQFTLGREGPGSTVAVVKS